MERTYEMMFIVRPDMAEEELDKLVSTLEAAATSHHGKVTKTEKMGKRRLAYAVRGFNDGFYIVLALEGSGDMVHEVERRLRVTEPVIKFITVRTDETDKKLAKIKAHRAAHVKRSTQQQQQVPVEAPATPAAAIEPAAPETATA